MKFTDTSVNGTATSASKIPCETATEKGYLTPAEIVEKSGSNALNSIISSDVKSFHDSLALDQKIGFFGGTASAVGKWNTLDRFEGLPAYFADGATITSEVSGTLTALCHVTTGNVGFVQRVNNSLLIKSATNFANVRNGSTITHTAGHTGVATFRITDAKNDAVRIGFTSSSYLPSGFAYIWHGVDVGSTGGGLTNAMRMVIAATGQSSTLNGNVKNGDIISIAMQLTADGYIVWVQGGPFEAWGAGVGSAGWIKAYAYTGGTLTGNLAFAAQHGGGAPLNLLQIGTTSNFTPDERRVRSLSQESASNRLDAHLGTAFYDSRGYLYTAWWNGTSDVDYDGSIVSLKVRTPQGIWSSTTTVATSGASTQYDMGTFFEKSDGTVVMVLNKTTDAAATDFRQVYRTVSVTSAAAITLGTETQLMASPPTFSLTYQHAVRITQGAHAGRIIIPCNTTHVWFSVYSDDDGTTWTKGSEYGSTLGADGYEPAIVEEGSQKVLASYVRCSGAISPKLIRYTSSDGGVTWSESGTIDVPSYENRAQAVRLPSGQVVVIGNDTSTNYKRPNITMWTVGEGGSVIGRLPVYTGSQTGLNYPGIACDGDRIAVVIPARKSTYANDAPAQIYFAEQTLKEWEDAVALRDKSRNVISGLPSTSLNEYLFQTKAPGSAASLTTNTNTGICSISLTPGEWDLEASVNFVYSSATVTSAVASIVTSGMANDGTEVYSGLQLTTTSATDGITLPKKRILVASTTTYYVTAKAVFSAGTATAYGTLIARRVR